MGFSDRLFGRQSVKVIGIILFFLILSSCASTSYYNLGSIYYVKGEYDKAIVDFTKAIEIDPNGATAYKNRGFAYYAKKEYDRAWEDVYKAQALGIKVDSVFLNVLRNASGRHR